MNDKLVSIEAVKCTLEKSYYGEATLGELLEDIDNIIAAPLPMLAVEYARTLYEMSDADLDGAFTDWSVAYHNEDFEEAVAIVERWAKEHPKEANNE